jgi:hypothetical protein
MLRERRAFRSVDEGPASTAGYCLSAIGRTLPIRSQFVNVHLRGKTKISAE